MNIVLSVVLRVATIVMIAKFRDEVITHTTTVFNALSGENNPTVIQTTPKKDNVRDYDTSAFRFYFAIDRSHSKKIEIICRKEEQ